MSTGNANFNIQGMAPYISVFDMPASIKFYRDLLGFKVIEASGEGDDVDWLMLKLNDIILMLNTAYDRERRPPAPDPVRIAAHGDITFYFGSPDIKALYTYLSGNGIDLQKPATTMYGWKAIRLKDPDGYELCFHWPIEGN